jgi:BirA family biotin operon repressor/biotin-[acetyl-CoA-carboxylase] ligase
VISFSESKSVGAVLSILRKAPGQPVSSEEIEKKTGMDKGFVKSSIKHLRESGVEIDTSGQGYALHSLPGTIFPALLHSNLKSRIIGWDVHSYKTVGSTNEVAKRLAESGAAEGALVISERQTRGRGRHGRSWHSPAGLGLYFTLILRPQVNIEKMPALSLVAALSIGRVLDKYAGHQAQIKWPNDCLLLGRKTAGILVELSAENDNVSYAVLGIGINLNQAAADFPSRLRSKATSVALVAGKAVDRAGFLCDFLYEFEKSYANFQRYGLRFLGPELVKRSVVLGKKVNITFGKKKISGRAIGFDHNGALRVQDRAGVHTFAAGEVMLR